MARKVCAHIAKTRAAREGDDVEVQAAGLLRRISVSVHRENARATLKRLPHRTLEASSSADPAAWAESPL